jgi:hypothetical protein
MNDFPITISLLFVAATCFSVWQLYKSASKSNTVLLFIGILMVLQTVLGLNGFFRNSESMPPRFLLLIGPGFITCLLLFITKKGRTFIDSLDIQHLTLLHIVRIPVEITLFFVYTAGFIPVLMTFEGYNFDIISGITAPVVYYLVFHMKKLKTKALLIWNFLCLGLLLNVVVIAILSAETPFQKLAFDRPNTGVTYFPFVWLPGIIVPIVLLSHLVAIRQILSRPAGDKVNLKKSEISLN